MDTKGLEACAAALREAIICGDTEKQASAPRDARFATASLASALAALSSGSSRETAVSALSSLQLALSSLRVIRNACACGSAAQSAIVDADGIKLCSELLQYLGRDALLRCDLPPELAALAEPELQSAPAFKDDDREGWASTSKLAVKASWQVLSNITAGDSCPAALSSSWLLFAVAATAAAAPVCSVLPDAIDAWCRADSTLTPVIGWMLHLLVANAAKDGVDAAAAEGRAARLRDFASNRGLLQCLCRLCGSAASDAAGLVASTDVEWFVGIVAALRTAGLFHAAYAACSAGAAEPRGAAAGTRFPVSFEQLVLLRALTAHIEDEEAAAAHARQRGADLPAGASSALHAGDAAGLLRELASMCRFLTPETASDASAGGAAAAGAGSSAGSSSAASEAEDGATGVAQQWCRRGVALLCALLADHLATVDSSSKAGTPWSAAATTGAEPGADAAADAATGGTAAGGAAAGGAAAGGAGVKAASTSSPALEAAVALSHVLAAHHAPVHRSPDAAGGAGAGVGTTFGEKRSRGKATSGAPGDFSSDAPGGGLSGLTDGFRLLALALTADHDSAEALAERCPGIVPLSLYHSQKMEAERPTLREWAVLCLRFLLSHSETARRIMRELQASMEVAKAKAEASADGVAGGR